MADTVLRTAIKEKELGVTVSGDTKVSEQCGITASKGNYILGLIVRPHLENGVHTWRP